MKTTVLIPTLRRPDDLGRCLEALARQERRPDQVVIVVRRDDELTASFLASCPPDLLPLEIAYTNGGGQVGALNTGLRHATGDIISILDDDTAPWADWLARIEQHFLQRPTLGGLGGRDILHTQGAADEKALDNVGRVFWYGRWVGQSHRGHGPVREVELLKGCNMSYRREAVAGIWFDTRLRGNGAQWFNDASFSLMVHRAGWDICYDPSVLVDHFHGTRQDGDDRQSTTPAEVYDAAFNETLALSDYLPPVRRALFLLFGFGVGNRKVPGLLQWLRLALTGHGHSAAYQLAAWKGRLDALRVQRLDQHPPAAQFDKPQSLSAL
jgi:glycosyltransferase involved in cell wall biosynthesis